MCGDSYTRVGWEQKQTRSQVILLEEQNRSEGSNSCGEFFYGGKMEFEREVVEWVKDKLEVGSETRIFKSTEVEIRHERENEDE